MERTVMVITNNGMFYCYPTTKYQHPTLVLNYRFLTVNSQNATVMGSIINKATTIFSKTAISITERMSDFRQDNQPQAKEITLPTINYPNGFLGSLSIKGKYALFVLFVLLASQLKAQNINTPNKNGPLNTQVNTLTGNLFVVRNDLFIPARGIDIDISFGYNTFNYKQNKGYGNGWSFTYGMAYRLDSGGVVTILQGDNREDKYTPTAGGAFAAMPGYFDNLTQYQTGKYLLQNKYGMKYYFDNSTHKRITKMQDLNGNVLNFGYTDSLVTSIANAAGQTITLTYNAGKLARVVDAIASPTRIFSYSYDGYGNLTQALDPLGNKTTYTYLINGPLSSTTDKNGNTADIIYNPDFTVSELISCNGRKSFSYDATSKTTVVTDYVPTSSNQITTYNYKAVTVGNTTQSWLSHLTGNCCGYNMDFTYDNAGNLATQKDANGNTYAYTYDASGNLLTITDPLGNKSSYTYSAQFSHVTGFTDPKGNSYAINYDNAGNPTQFIEPGNLQATATYSSLGDRLTSTDANGNTNHYSYDAYGYPSQLSQPLNSNFTYTFDARGNYLSTTDPNGHTASLQYDALNRMTTIKDALNHSATVTRDNNGNITSFTDQNGHAIFYGYDASNRLVTTTNALGNKQQYTYDAVNNLIQYKDQLNKITTFTYDNLNRLTAITDALGNGYSFGYDYNGNRITANYPSGASIHYVYDKLNRPISGSDNLGSLGTITYDANGNVASYTNGTGATISTAYDALNRIVSRTDPLGYARTFTYDNNDNVKSTTDRNGHTATYNYDALSRRTSFVDNNGNTTNVTYDAAGNIISVKDANNNVTNFGYDELRRLNKTTYPDGSTINTTYDNTHNILNKKLADGSTIAFNYDNANRLIGRTLPNNTYTYNYDAKSRLIGATNAAGTVSLTYDDINRLLAESYNAHTVNYSYNTVARIKTTLYPDGTSIAKTYNSRFNIVSIKQGATAIADYQYNNADQLTQLTYGNGLITNWQYDQSNRLTNLTTQSANLPNINYSYDKESNKTASLRPASTSASEQYNYDAANRLVGFTQGTAQSTFTYDALGNRTNANLNGINNTYSKNNLNQYTNLTNSSQNINFTYDGNGNLTYDGTFYKRYDIEGKLLVDSNSNSKITYLYDAFGRRVQKVINGKAFNYYYSGISQLELRDATTDTVINETVYSGAITPVLLGINHNQYYYHQNDLNSVEAITNANGNVVEHYQYKAYGAVSLFDSLGNAITASNIGNRFAFTGQEYDALTNTYHSQYRNYSPVTGSFNQRDPIGYTENMGLYQYTDNNPTNGIDLLGLSPCPPTTQSTPVPPTTTYTQDNSVKPDFGNESGYFGWGLDGVSTSTSTVSTVQSTLNVVQNGLAPAEGAIPVGGAKLFTNSVGFNVAGQALNGAGLVTNLYDLSNYHDQGNSNDIYNKADLASGAVMNGAGLVPGPAQILLGGYGILNSANKAALGQSLPQDFEPIAIESGNNGIFAAFSKYGDHTTSDLYDRYQNMTTEQKTAFQQKMQQRQQLQEINQNMRTLTPNPNIITIHLGGNNCPPNDNNHGTQAPTIDFAQPPVTPPIPYGITIVTNNINSQDPNEIIGPTGVGTPQFVNAVDLMPYTINFENSINASAPAKTVRVNYPIDAKQDMNNISLGSFGFNSLTFNVPPNTAAYYQRLDARDSLGLYVDITAGLDVNNHQIFWVFQSIDPVTLLTPADPLKGFLLLTDTSKPSAGHGFVNFFIKPVNGSVTGDTVHAVASIVFDGNDTIPTNVAKNTIDAVAPTSHMNALPANSASAKVSLTWTAADDAKGSGVKSYSLYVSVNNGAFGLYATNISKKDTTFTGASGNSYSFFVLGTDSVGNTETLKPGAEATTYINAIALPVTWLYFNAVSQGKDGFLTWATATETNSKSFDIERSIDGRNFTKIGATDAAGNSTVQTNYTYTDVNVVALNIPVVYYRLKQIDKDGKATYSNIVAVQLPVINVGPIVQAYPNPFKQTLNILIANMTALDLSDNIGIYTLEGKKVYEKQIGQRLLNTTITLTDLPTLTPGMYILKLGLNKQTYSFKLMKQ